jgi:carbohydrate kinase (thermoresistant glucokinase family)
MIVVVMGVCGCGKTTVGEELARRLGADFAEGDSFHPPANVEKMRGGTPLDDDDRWPWLRAIAAAIDAARAEGRHLVVACSALKQAYRDVLMGDRPDCWLVYLRGDAELITERMAARPQHFMPASLLPSQLATLEPPAPAANVIAVDIDAAPETLVAQVEQALKAGAVPPNARAADKADATSKST